MGYFMSMELGGHRAIINRLKRIEGQVRGLIGMVEEGRYCVDIMTQVEAVRGALSKVETELLKMHAQTCVEEALRDGPLTEKGRKFSELVDLFERIGS